MRLGSIARRGLALTSPLVIAGCAGAQSALAPQGPQAEQLARLFWIMTAGGVAVFVIVMIFVAVALYAPARLRERLADDAMVFAGGVIFPVVTLSALLIYNFTLLGRGPEARESGDRIDIRVTGERWWWRVAYVLPDGSKAETANELRVPVGRSVDLHLTSADVIHSFWAPSLAGKLDMFPGRETTMRLVADKAGVSRGQCAEYCGGPHAMMAFNVVAMAPDDYAQWLRGQTETARAPQDASAGEGQKHFTTSGCGVCHSIRGTTSVGLLGPDLTHVGSRLAIGAGVLPVDQASIAGWIVDNQHVKPGNKMPAYATLEAGKVAAISAYLAGLR
jgi:cytochrome c oxidase subunit 2